MTTLVCQRARFSAAVSFMSSDAKRLLAGKIFLQELVGSLLDFTG